MITKNKNIAILFLYMLGLLLAPLLTQAQVVTGPAAQVVPALVETHSGRLGVVGNGNAIGPTCGPWSFTVNVPGTGVRAAYLSWETIGNLPDVQGDATATVDVNAAGPVGITADYMDQVQPELSPAYGAAPGTNFVATQHLADVTSLIGTGVNNIVVDGIAPAGPGNCWGVFLTVIYEDVSEPYKHYSMYHSSEYAYGVWTDVSEPLNFEYTIPFCPVTAADAPVDLDYENYTFIYGIHDNARPHLAYIQTGSGSEPSATTILGGTPVDSAFAVEEYGPELDWHRGANVSGTLSSGDDYVCRQYRSQDVAGTHGNPSSFRVGATLFGLDGYMDLALRKTLATTGSIAIGDDVTFDIEVFNQGSIAADNIEIIDYLPTNVTPNDPDWTDNGNGTASITATVANGLLPTGGLAAGSSVTIPITVHIAGDPGENAINEAEIVSLTDNENQSQTDVDSTPDSTNGNDTEVDNEIGNAGGDEDDADIATITLGETVEPVECTEPAIIGNEIYNDLNCNGEEDYGEDGWKDIEVELRDENDEEVDEDDTNKEGKYNLEAPRTGRYKVVIKKSDIDHLLQTEDPGSSVKLNNEAWVDVTECGQRIGNIDFGFSEKECTLATTGADVMCVE